MRSKMRAADKMRFQREEKARKEAQAVAEEKKEVGPAVGSCEGRS